MTTRLGIQADGNNGYSAYAATNRGADLWLHGDVTNGPRESLGRSVRLHLDARNVAGLLAFLAQQYPDAVLAVAGAVQACDAATDHGYGRKDGNRIMSAGYKRVKALQIAANNSMHVNPTREEVSK